MTESRRRGSDVAGGRCRSPVVAVQGDLFTAPDDARAKARMKAVDALNGRYGRDTVRFAATGIRRDRKRRSEFISPRYTTCWEELLTMTDRQSLQEVR